MSDMEKMCGISYKLDHIKNDDEALNYFLKYLKNDIEQIKQEYKEIWKEEWFNLLFCDKKLSYKNWRPYYDVEGNYGWKLDIGDKNNPDDYDLGFQLSFIEIKQQIEILSKIMFDHNDTFYLKNINVYALNYYNGTDCPFKF